MTVPQYVQEQSDADLLEYGKHIAAVIDDPRWRGAQGLKPCEFILIWCREDGKRRKAEKPNLNAQRRPAGV